MAKPKIAVLAGEELFASFFDDRRRARLDRLARWDVHAIHGFEGEIPPGIAEANALITTWDSPQLTAATMKRMPSVRMVAHCGGEVKKRFDVSLFRRIVITNTPEPMARPTAELGAAFLMYAARDIDHYRAALRTRSNRIYKDVHIRPSRVESLLGGEVGMIGFGRVGRAMVDLLRGFRIQWKIFDPYASRQSQGAEDVQFASLNMVLRRSSLLVVTAAATEKSRGLLNRERLAMLPDGATVVNVARGSLIDLDALTREVEGGRLRCALDVTDPEEPLPIDHPLRRLPGSILTPHIGGNGQHTRGEMADEVIDELERFFRGEAVKNRVTTGMLSRMT